LEATSDECEERGRAVLDGLLPPPPERRQHPLFDNGLFPDEWYEKDT
jgi:hypothetical protein